MATTSTSTRSLVDSQEILYIRESAIRCTATDVRPNTKMYVFFDDEEVTAFCAPGHADLTYPTGNTNEIVSDTSGKAVFTFFIAGGKYKTGSKTIIVADVQDLSLLQLGGNVYGSATAKYTTKGTAETFQRVTTNTTTVTNHTVNEVINYVQPPPQIGDPLAQSFFTYGAKAGIFVTAVELFFQSKDNVMPIWVELREMVNGYPAPMKPGANADLTASLLPSQVNISGDASVGTIFRFPVPVYLPEDKEFCFVAVANSAKYNVFTSSMGERSIETAAIIFEQPYSGSMFKSQNNSTWTAEQFEDVKFNIYKAEFKTSPGELSLVGSSPSRLYQGERFYTTSGTDKVVLKGFHQHGLNTGDKITISIEDSGTYNGIPGTALAGHRHTTKIIDEYTLEFQAGAAASSTGNILTSGKVYNVAVINNGSGYTTAPLVTIAAPVSGTQATAVAEVYNGKISRITITNPGSGYVTAPTVIISGTGVGAEAIAPVDVLVGVTTNKSVHVLSPQIKHSVVQDTVIDSKIRLANASYGFAPEKDIALSQIAEMPSGQYAASRQNEFDRMGNSSSVRMDVVLRSTNANVSPMIDARSGMNLMAYTNSINDLSSEESVESSVASSGVTGYTNLYGGTGYVSTPAITIVAAENDKSRSIVPATATAVISSGQVTSITISPGSGYTKPPTIVIDPPPAGTTATAQAQIAVINSEIGNNGNAYSRYVTKKISLLTTSTAIKLSSYLYSSPVTNVEWYVRTSLTSDATMHEENEWKLLKCDTRRDKSSKKGQFFDYDFYLFDLQEFDTYDLKCVLSSTDPVEIPFIKNYRVVVAA